MPEMHLKQTGFTFNACGPFTKKIERIQKCKETGNLRYIFRNELEKACFEHGKAYGDFKNLPKRTASNKVLCGKAFNIAKNQRGLFSMVHRLFNKNPTGGAIKSKNIWNQKLAARLAEKLHKPIIKKLGKRKAYSLFKDNT